MRKKQQNKRYVSLYLYFTIILHWLTKQLYVHNSFLSDKYRPTLIPTLNLKIQKWNTVFCALQRIKGHAKEYYQHAGRKGLGHCRADVYSYISRLYNQGRHQKHQSNRTTALHQGDGQGEDESVGTAESCRDQDTHHPSAYHILYFFSISLIWNIIHYYLTASFY